MKKNITLSFLLLISISIFISCSQNKEDIKYQTAPPEVIKSPKEHCDTLMLITYRRLQNSGIHLVTNNFPQKGNINRRIYFENILEEKFNLKLLPIFDTLFYPKCVIPIMDSAIASKYGPNGKDSIIKVVNYLADSTYNAEVKHSPK